MQADICVVIPTVAAHLPYLLDVLASVRKQSLPPRATVVALSGATPAQCAEANETIRLGGSTAHLLCSDARRNAAQSRNTGASACPRSDAFLYSGLISFIDGDDTMLPERLRTITQLMRDTDATVGLHAYLGQRGATARGTPPRVLPPARVRQLEAQSPQKPDGCGCVRVVRSTCCLHFLPSVHHGHATVAARALGRGLRYKEGAAFERVEDSAFVRDAVRARKGPKAHPRGHVSSLV